MPLRSCKVYICVRNNLTHVRPQTERVILLLLCLSVFLQVLGSPATLLASSDVPQDIFADSVIIGDAIPPPCSVVSM